MKRYFSPLMVILILLGGCSTLKSPVKKVVENRFYCSHPKMEVEVSPDFRYKGEQLSRKDVDGYHGGGSIALFPHAYVFEGPNREELRIIVLKVSGGTSFQSPSIALDSIKGRFDSGKSKLGNHQYHYCTFRRGKYIGRLYLRNAYNDSIRIGILYVAPGNKDISEKEEMTAFNQNCRAAFTAR